MNPLFIETEKIQDPREGILQIVSNIETCNKISEIIESTLGPYGRDKLFVSSDSKNLITNDGATILRKMNIVHPIGKLLVKMSESQDNEVGDGTTSVVIQTCALLNSLKNLIKEGIDLNLLYETLMEIKLKCLEFVKTLKLEYNEEFLLCVAETSLISKNVRNLKRYFAEMITKAICNVESQNLDLIGVVKITGGGLSDSKLVDGIAFEKCFTYAGYEQQPKKIVNPKILCINDELEWKSERDNSEINIDSVSEYKKVVDVEWSIIRGKLDRIIETGANVVISGKPIGDYATQYFAKRNIFSAGRVAQDDLKRIAKAFGCTILSTTNYLEGAVGTCKLFEERQIGKERYNYLEGENVKACTLILRGPGEETLNEVERSLNDALQAVKRVRESYEVVTGGGTVEMEISKFLKELSDNFSDKKYFICKAASQSFEKIPHVLSSNFGLDTTVVMPLLRKSHKEGKSFMGVGFKGVVDIKELNVYEPLQNKLNIIKTSFDVAAAIIMIDSTILNGNKQ